MARGWAAGYGIKKADCVELREINAEFVSAEKSPETAAPLSGLLKDGVYLLTDASSHNKAVISALLTTGTIWDIILLENIFRG